MHIHTANNKKVKKLNLFKVKASWSSKMYNKYYKMKYTMLRNIKLEK